MSTQPTTPPHRRLLPAVAEAFALEELQDERDRDLSC